MSDRIPAYALYIDPPLGRVGMSEADVRKRGRPALIGKLAMEDVSRAFEKGETEGFMKILVDAESKEILGASFLGTSGDEAIHCVLDTMYAKAPYTLLTRAMHIHPTVAEFIPTILGDLVPLPDLSGTGRALVGSLNSRAAVQGAAARSGRALVTFAPHLDERMG